MGKPPKIPDTGPDYEEVVETIHEATNGIDFGPGFMSDLLLFFQKNVRDVFSGQTTFFILGSYRNYPIRRLNFAAGELNSRPMTYAFVLCDLLDPDEIAAYQNDTEDEESSDEWTPDSTPETTDSGNETDTQDLSPPMSHCQFYLLAAYCDYVVPVFEGRHAGPSVELGELRNNFFGKSHVFRREYEEFDEDGRGLEALNGQELSSSDKIDPDVSLSNAYSRPQWDLFTLFEAEDRLYRWERRSDLATRLQTLPDS